MVGQRCLKVYNVSQGWHNRRSHVYDASYTRSFIWTEYTRLAGHAAPDFHRDSHCGSKPVARVDAVAAAIGGFC